MSTMDLGDWAAVVLTVLLFAAYDVGSRALARRRGKEEDR